MVARTNRHGRQEGWRFTRVCRLHIERIPIMNDDDMKPVSWWMNIFEGKGATNNSSPTPYRRVAFMENTSLASRERLVEALTKQKQSMTLTEKQLNDIQEGRHTMQLTES